MGGVRGMESRQMGDVRGMESRQMGDVRGMESRQMGVQACLLLVVTTMKKAKQEH